MISCNSHWCCFALFRKTFHFNLVADVSLLVSLIVAVLAAVVGGGGGN